MNRKFLLRWGGLLGLCVAVALGAATWLTSDSVTGRDEARSGSGPNSYGPPAKPREPIDSVAKRSAKGPGSPGDPAADWPQFLGPFRDNRSRETGLLESLPDDGPALLWTAKGFGEGLSSVAVSRGVVYTMGTDGEQESIFALNLDDGGEIWRTPIDHKLHDGMGNGPRSTPAVDDNRVYSIGSGGVLACLNTADGELIWKKDLLPEFGGSMIPWGICESALIDGDRVLCTPGGPKAGIVALDKRDGKVIWTSNIPQGNHAAYSSIVPADFGGVRQYVQFLRHGTVGVRASDGLPLWSNNRSANRSANCTSPLVIDDMVFSASGYNTGGAMLKLVSDAKVQKTTAELGYFNEKVQVHHGGMVCSEGHVYAAIDSGPLVCLELKTNKIKWLKRSAGKGSVTAVDGKLIVRSEGGPLAYVKMNPANYEELGRFEQKEPSGRQTWAYPVVAQGKLFLRDQDKLFCYLLKKK